MNERDENKPVLRGEVLPPNPRSVSLAPEVSHLPAGMLGMTLFARARYASEQRQFEAYSRLVYAKNGLLRALTEQKQLMVNYALEDERAQNLDSLRAIARLQIGGQINEILRKGEIDALRHDIELERLMLDRDRSRRAREDFNVPRAPSDAPMSSTKKPTLADDFGKIGKEIEEIEQAYEQLRSDIIERAGGEDRLTGDQRDRLRSFEMLRDKLLNEAMTALF